MKVTKKICRPGGALPIDRHSEMKQVWGLGSLPAVDHVTRELPRFCLINSG
jgi:hypothetical protein